MSAFNNFLFKNHFLSLFLIILVTFLSQVSIAQSPYRLINTVLEGDMEEFDNLIEAGMDPDIRYYGEMTALMHAAWMGRLDAIKALIKAGADPTLQGGFYEMTSLMFAAQGGYLDIVKFLINTSRRVIDSIDSRDNIGRTAFMRAVAWGRWDVAEVLLEAGADPDLLDINDMTILMSAAWEGDLGLNTVEFLANHTEADLDLQGRGNLTALMWVAWEGHLNVVKALVEAGASLKVQNNGSTALDYAVAAGHTDVANYLMEAGEGGVRGWFCRHLSIRCY